MVDFPWLPVGFELGGGMSPGRLLENGDSYQIVADRSGASILRLDEAAMP